MNEHINEEDVNENGVHEELKIRLAEEESAEVDKNMIVKKVLIKEELDVMVMKETIEVTEEDWGKEIN